MPRICLLALIGLPGAGKTYLSHWLMEQQPAVLGSWNVLHVCYDDYFHLETTNSHEYKEQRNSIHQLLTELIATLRSKTLPELPPKVRRSATAVESSNYLIICDDNHYYRSMRYKLYQLCRAQNCIYAQIYVASSLTTCLLANEVREASGIVPASTIRQMHTRLEEPSAEAWACNSLTLTDSDFQVASNTICDFIKSLLNTQIPVQPEATVKQLQLQSLTHRLDLQLRQRIQAQMQTATPTNIIPKDIRSRTLNDQRKQILAQFRLKIIDRQTEFDQVNLEYYVNLLK